MTDKEINQQTYLGVGAALILGIAILLSAMSYGRSEPYVRIDGGVSSVHSIYGYNLNLAPAIELGVGYRWMQNLRSDVTLGYRSYKLDDTVSSLSATGRISSFAAMFNTYFDIGQFGSFTPYIGAGIGASQNRVHDTVLNGTANLSGATKTAFAWQASAGVGIAMSPQWTLDIGYRYMDMGKAMTGTDLSGVPVTALTSRLAAHEGRVGLRYGF